ncbi:transposase [Streptomyces sp. NPDC048506]|uniref:transposase n=1 Tax=Streptomyces sp. NPDC048506 TaxID=3155028 RepID=UPI00343F1ECD
MPLQSTAGTRECDCLAHRFGNAADNPQRKRRYPTDMTDAEWAVVRPPLPVPGWMRGRGGQPEAYCHHAMLDAIAYLVDNGIKWRAMPADFPPWDRSMRSSAAGATATWSGSSMTGCAGRSVRRRGGILGRRPG